MANLKIYIDPGHGGNDPGAVGNGLREKDLTLAIALRLRNILVNEYDNVQVRMSRTTDTSVSLNQRTDDANAWGADYLISIHINAGGGEGFEIHTYNGSYAGKSETNAKAKAIHDAIIRETNWEDRGCKESNFHMVRESDMSAALSENGFIDNSSDAWHLKQDDFLDKIARGHAIGLENALGLVKKQSSFDLDPYPAKSPSMYRLAKLRDTANPDLIRQLKADGYIIIALPEGE